MLEDIEDDASALFGERCRLVLFVSSWVIHRRGLFCLGLSSRGCLAMEP